MKRDMELIRKILLSLQEGMVNSSFDGVDDDTLKYHQALLIERELVEGVMQQNFQTSTNIPLSVILKKLTWEGHDFIDGIHDEDKWEQIKVYLKEGGKIVSLESIKQAIAHLFT